MLPNEDQWFFIAGCQRSGTTLLRLVIECHSQVFCFDEANSYRVLAQRTYEGEIRQRLVGFKIPRLTEQLDAQRVFDLGLSEQIGRFYKGQRVIFIVRDVRDVVSSMLKLRGDKSWLEDWAIPILENKTKVDPEFAQRFSRELTLCRESASLAAYGACYWSYKNEALLRYVRSGHPVLPVRYESLVESPASELKRICSFLGIELEATMLSHAEHPHAELDETGLAIGNTDPKRSIDVTSVGQWARWLNDRDERLISELAAPVATRIASLLEQNHVVARAVRPAQDTSSSIHPPRAPQPVRGARGFVQGWALSGWLAELGAACAIAMRPAWSLGASDVVFWLAALATAFVGRASLGSPRSLQRGSWFGMRVQRVSAMTFASFLIWLLVQSIELPPLSTLFRDVGGLG